MTLTPRERFRMIQQVLSEVEENNLVWSANALDVLLQQFGLEAMDLDQWSVNNEFARLLGGAPDDTLLDIYATVLDISDDDARLTAAIPADHGLWKDGYVRVFLSHSATEKAFVGKVAAELAIVGVHGFVAHDTIEIEKPWQSQIEIALRTAEAFVGLVHEPFNESAWCQQEVGWAKGRAIPEFFIRLGGNPQGFAGSTQWPTGNTADAKSVAHQIVAWLERKTTFANSIVDGLLGALRESGNYYDAEAAAKRIVALGELTPKSWDFLDEAYWSNDQVYGGVLPNRVLKPFYYEHKRPYPPLKPAPQV